MSYTLLRNAGDQEPVVFVHRGKTVAIESDRDKMAGNLSKPYACPAGLSC